MACDDCVCRVQPGSTRLAGIKIISKIESWHGLINYDEILAVSDGIMIARGDLAMEVGRWAITCTRLWVETRAPREFGSMPCGADQDALAQRRIAPA
jgi:hypothetical protein